MPARRLQIGEHGAIAYVTGASGRVTASMYYRNGQGQRRRIGATADSKTAAHREAVRAFEQAMATGGGIGYSKRTTFRELAGEWFERFEQLVQAGRRSPASASLYRSTLDRHVLPVIGGLRLTELTTSRIDAFLHGVLRDKGHATAKVCRSVVSGVCGLAVRRGGLRSNPVRDVGDLERGDRKGARRCPRRSVGDGWRSWTPIRTRCARTCPTWLASCSGPVSGSARQWASPGMMWT